MMLVIKEPNYTQYPNVILDNMSQFEHPEYKVISAIVRQTFGYHQKSAKISLNELVKMTGMAKNTIIRAANNLEQKGVIQRTPDAKGTQWELVVEVVQQMNHLQSISGAADEPLDDQSGSLDELPTNTRDLLKKKDLKKDQGQEETEEEVFSFIPDSLQDLKFIEVWKEWEEHRKQIRHKLTPLTRKKQLKQLSSVPLSVAIHMINTSIEKGWQGLFPPKDDDPIWQEVQDETVEEDPWAMYKAVYPDKFNGEKSGS